MNLTKENKKKAIYIGALAIILVGGLMLNSSLSAEEEEQPSEEFFTPESERVAYDNKLQALGTRKEQTNMGSFEESFQLEERKAPEKKDDNEDLFSSIDRQIANIGGTKEPEPPKEVASQKLQNTAPAPQRVQSTGGGGTVRQRQPKQVQAQNDEVEEVPKKSRRQLREERLAQEGENTFKDVDNAVNQYQQANTNTPTIKRRVGEKPKFEDLPETEQRRILLQTGQRNYQESREISAKIVSTGNVKSGSTIRVMLQEKAVLSFKVIPSGTVITGEVSFDKNRMKVTFSTIRLKNEIVSVNLDLYASDGLLGLPIDGESHTREAEDSGLDEAVSATGRLGRIVGGVGKTIGSVSKSIRRSRDESVNLGNNISCILLNRNVE